MCASTRKTMSFRPGILRHCVWIVMSAGFALTLSACGGGGGGGGGQQQNNVAPTAQAGADQTVALPATVQLQGSATDDGLPSGSSLSYAWTVTQGSGVTLGSASTAATSATFTAPGTYVLTLTASDGSLSGSDQVQVTVNAAANAAPVVQAGADQTITLPANSVQLQGSATDDGLPSGSSLTYTWTVTQGSGVTLGSASSASTSATFTAPGVHVLTLTVSDGSLSGSDQVQVTVTAAANAAPVAQAGADQTIELPVDTAQLQGSATDDGAASSLTYSWAVIGGPGTVTFGGANAAATSAKFSATGAYVLRLTVSDGSLSATDDMAVTVNAAVYPAADTDDSVPDRGWTRVAAADVGMNATFSSRQQRMHRPAASGGTFGGAA